MKGRMEQLLGAIGEARARGRADEARPRRARRLFSVVLLAVFAMALLGMVALGTTAYRRLSSQNDAVLERRAALAVVANAVRSTDAVGSVGRGAGPEGDALVLVERLGTGTYETRIYLSEGWIVQEYAVAGAEYRPEAATRVVRSSSFGFEIGDGLVVVRCDAGESCVALRAAGSGAAGTGAAAGAGGAAGAAAEGVAS